MDKTNKISDFLSEDIAYLLGLIVGKGVFVVDGQVRRLVITFPYKNLLAEGYKHVYDKPLELSNSLDSVVNRIRKYGFNVAKESDNKNDISLIIIWNQEDLSWQILKYLLNDEFTDFHSFRIPKAIFESDREVQKEFLRGYFDTTGHIRKSNSAFGKEDQHRVYLEVDQRNWLLIPDLVMLLGNVGVSIHTIDFGHPNFRDPEFKKASGFWAKEHQLKIYANQFSKIGSYIKHKDEVLKELAEKNSPGLGEGDNERGSRSKIKSPNPEEGSEKLPDFLRGKHFNNWRELLSNLITESKNG
jgi:hypothetical protein